MLGRNTASTDAIGVVAAALPLYAIRLLRTPQHLSGRHYTYETLPEVAGAKETSIFDGETMTEQRGVLGWQDGA